MNSRFPRSFSETKPVRSRISVFRCSWKECRMQIFNFKNTPFSKSKIETFIFLKVLDCWLHRLKTKSIAFVLGISCKCIRRILNSVGKVIVPKYYSSTAKICFNDCIIEVDESKLLWENQISDLKHVIGSI